MFSNVLSDTTRGYSEAAHLWSPVFPIMLKVPKARSEHTVCVYQGTLYLLGGRGITAYKDFWKYDLGENRSVTKSITNNFILNILFDHLC